MTSTALPLTVFFDNSCPLCRREVDLLREHDVNGRLLFVDCSPADFATVEGHTRDAMMKLIHSRDANGQWLIGPPVFGAAYKAVGLDSIANMWDATWLQPIWKWLYPWIANNRMWLSKTGLVSLGSAMFRRIAASRTNARAEKAAANKCDLESKSCRIE